MEMHLTGNPDHLHISTDQKARKTQVQNKGGDFSCP